MSVRLPESPPSASELVLSALRHFSVGGRCTLRTLRGKRLDAIKLVHAHPVYTFGLQDVTQGRELREAACTGWRFLLMEGDATSVAAAELAIDRQSSALRFVGVNAGPYVASTVTALQTRLCEPELKSRDWLVRLLRIPSVYVMALWLHDASSGEDRLWALGPVPKNLEENRMYSWPHFSDALNKVAQVRLTTKESNADKRM
jgi:hypothetical protein